MFLLFLWLLLCFLVSFYASKKGHNAKVLFIVSLFLSPIVGFFITLFRGINREVLESNSIAKSDQNKCSHCADLDQDCADLIKGRNMTCMYCGEDIPKLEVKVELKTEVLEGTVEKVSVNKAEAKYEFNLKIFLLKIWLLCFFLMSIKFLYLFIIHPADGFRMGGFFFYSLGYTLLLYAVAGMFYLITSMILSFKYKVNEELCLGVFRYVCIYGSFLIFLVPGL